MIRKIIKIDEEKCNGCGACAKACHEGAIDIVSGKAKLAREDYCDGLGDCLPNCPMNAITFEEREAPEYNEQAVLNAKMKKSHIKLNTNEFDIKNNITVSLNNWPIQIKLAPMIAPYFDNAHLIIASDCTAFAYSNFHRTFVDKNVVLIGCPKLDDCDYSEKLSKILSFNNIKSIKVIRMEVPCCGGMEYAVKKAIVESGKDTPCEVIIITTDGKCI